MSKHTPAPWKICEENRRFEILYAGKEPTVYVGRIAKTYRHAYEENDARLIAAAPLMYDYILKRAGQGDEEAQRIVEEVQP